MTDNSTIDTSAKQFDTLQERNQQVLNNISQLQTQEKTLYEALDDVSLSPEQKQQIIAKINEISQMRMNLYTGLKDMYSSYQQNVSASSTALGQSIVAVDILENELNEAKIKMNMIEDQKYNKLRLVEINTYFGQRYNAHAKLMKTVVFTCIPVIILAVLFNKGLLPSNIYKLLVVIVLVIGVIAIGYQIIDISNRDNMNWNEYNWYFDQKNAPTDVPVSNPGDPWDTPSVSMTCIGSACCYEGSTYDSSKNMCVPNEVYETEQVKESFRALDKYAYKQINLSSANDDVSPMTTKLTNF